MGEKDSNITISKIFVSLVLAIVGAFMIAGSMSLLLSALGIINETILSFIMCAIGLPLLIVFFLIALGTKLNE